MIVNKIQKRKASEIVAEQLEAMIMTENFIAGDKLPSTRELCTMFHVGRSTIRDAIHLLNGKGVVHVKQGEGIYVSEFDPIKLFNRTAVEPNHKEIKELFQVRKLLEAGIAKEAALHGSSHTLSLLENPLMNEPIGWESDYQFHMAIAHATGNNILIHFMEFISDTLKKTMNEFHVYIQHDENIVQTINEQHIQIFTAIKKGLPNVAYDSMLEHLNYVEKRLEDRLKTIQSS